MQPQTVTLFGHPVGLYTLFFAEMWERFSYYGMRALLVLFMMKGFLAFDDKYAYIVYGAYTSLVYMTPFFGGILADKLLGARRAVVFGGLMMAAGQLTLMAAAKDGILDLSHQTTAFYIGLGLLICGNGFFKPNISTIVGTLYPKDSTRRDGGFTIFYMGVNLGAALSPLLCGYVGETYGWHLGFGMAAIGMLTGLAVFVMPTLVTQVLIMSGVLAAVAGLLWFKPDNPYSIAFNIFVAASLLIAGIIAMVALHKEGLPDAAGSPPDREFLRKPFLGPISREWFTYLASVAAIVLFTLLVSGFSMFTKDHKAVTLIPETAIQSLEYDMSQVTPGTEVDLKSLPPNPDPVKKILAVVLKDISSPAGLILMLSGLIALIYLGIETFRMQKVARERMFVVLILTFFSLVFWAFFEQAGSSVNNFTDRNVDRVFSKDTVTAEQVGKTIQIQPTQEQLGYHNGEALFTLDALDKLRKENKATPDFEIRWVVNKDNVGMGITKRSGEIPASTFQAVNPICILTFGLVFTALWSFLGSRGWEPNTCIKFAMGLLQLGLGFGAFWYGAKTADSRGMVAMVWLVLGYALHTTGELCLSPVGLSMITKLTPARLVSTVMGMWFLATAFSQLLASTIAQFTGAEGGGGNGSIPAPAETVGVYGGVFGQIAICAFIVAVICFALSPLLNKWMHRDVISDEG
jgi:POT family proton-dependent oligopeptide transporter